MFARLSFLFLVCGVFGLDLKASGQDVRMQIKAMIERGKYENHYTQSPDSIQNLLLEAQLRAREIQNKPLLREATHALGGFYYTIGDYITAIREWQYALLLAQELNMPEQEAFCYNNLGEAYNRLGQEALSLSYHQKALALLQQLNSPLGNAQNLISLGDTYTQLSDYQKARQYYERSKSILDTFPNMRLYTDLLQRLGRLEKRQHNLKEAVRYYRSALQYAQQRQDFHTLSLVYIEIGDVFCRKRQSDSANFYFQAGLKLAQNGGFRALQVTAYQGLARKAFAGRNFQEAIRLSEQALVMAQELRLGLHELKSLDLLHQSYAATKGYQQALYYHKQYKEKSDRLFNEDKDRQIGGLEAHMEQEARNARRRLEVSRREKYYQQRITRQENFQIILSFFISIVFILAAIVFSGYRLLQQKNKQLERQKEQITFLNENLEQQVRKRTGQLEDYAYMNAHKVRGPLARIQGLANLFILPHILDGSTEEEQRIIEQINVASEQLDQVIRAINEQLQE